MSVKFPRYLTVELTGWRDPCTYSEFQVIGLQ
jgi:hypothetical protein